MPLSHSLSEPIFESLSDEFEILKIDPDIFRDPYPSMCCVNDFRLLQNIKNPLSLTAFANLTIHKSIETWKGKLDPLQFILTLEIPKHQKVIILLEYISCEKHNFHGDPTTHKYHMLYNFLPCLKFIPNKFFNEDPLYPNLIPRFFSKSIWLLLYLEKFIHLRGEELFLHHVSIKNLTHELLTKRLLYEACTFPITHCPEIPLIKHIDTIVCKNNKYALSSYGYEVRTFDHGCIQNNFYTYTKWKLKPKSYSFHELFSYD